MTWTASCGTIAWAGWLFLLAAAELDPDRPAPACPVDDLCSVEFAGESVSGPRSDSQFARLQVSSRRTPGRTSCRLISTLAVEGPSIDQSLADSIWFDASASELRPVKVSPRSDDSLNRGSRWLPKPGKVKQANKPTTAATGGGLIGSGLTFANLLGWLLLILVAVSAVGLLAYLISNAEAPEAGRSTRSRTAQPIGPTGQRALDRIKHLPAELRRTDVHARSEAERLMQAGQFDQAVILLYAHQLLLLDHAGMLRLSRGKTNRRYVDETTRADAQASRWLRSTVDAFERSYFGRHRINSIEFQQLWQANAELEALARRRQEVAA